MHVTLTAIDAHQMTRDSNVSSVSCGPFLSTCFAFQHSTNPIFKFSRISAIFSHFQPPESFSTSDVTSLHPFMLSWANDEKEDEECLKF